MDAVATQMLTFFAYPYATRMDAVVTRMLTILRIRLQEHTRGRNLKMMECTQRKQTE